ncbi:MAG: hypothetical protein MUE37_03385 [Bacteroidales bacterium]|jgi:hypothetical protein|nr:hypothetical protein [Bacteroidales bacterium]
MVSRKRRVWLRLAAMLLLLYMLSFASCDTVPICWYCENPHNTSEWQQVCNAMTKSKLESYGWDCTPF